MNRVMFSIVAVCILPMSVHADYVPTSFADLAGTSDAIVVGTITKVDDDTFALQVEDLIIGPVRTGETITIRRFHDWACAWRWSRYEVGQKVLVFLNSSKEYGQWVSRGAGCEGESPVVEDNVYANFGGPGEVIEYGNSRLGKSRLRAIPYDQLRTAILYFRATFRITPAKDPWQKHGEYSVYVPFDRIDRITKPTSTLFRSPILPPDFRNRSPLHRHLAETVDEERRKIEKYNRQ